MKVLTPKEISEFFYGIVIVFRNCEFMLKVLI